MAIDSVRAVPRLPKTSNDINHIMPTVDAGRNNTL
jgi:hypothetical protein